MTYTKLVGTYIWQASRRSGSVCHRPNSS